jgi:hypothetical protein
MGRTRSQHSRPPEALLEAVAERPPPRAGGSTPAGSARGGARVSVGDPRREGCDTRRRPLCLRRASDIATYVQDASALSVELQAALLAAPIARRRSRSPAARRATWLRPDRFQTSRQSATLKRHSAWADGRAAGMHGKATVVRAGHGVRFLGRSRHLGRRGGVLEPVVDAPDPSTHRVLQRPGDRDTVFAFQGVAASREQLDRRANAHGHGRHAHRPQEVRIEPGQVLGHEIVAAHRGLRGKPPDPVPERGGHALAAGWAAEQSAVRRMRRGGWSPASALNTPAHSLVPVGTLPTPRASAGVRRPCTPAGRAKRAGCPSGRRDRSGRRR